MTKDRALKLTAKHFIDENVQESSAFEECGCSCFVNSKYTVNIIIVI